MLNICCSLTFPALPSTTFDLVLATCSYNSVLLEAAANATNDTIVDLEELANEVFSKKGAHIRVTFEQVISDIYGINYKADYYVVADRASNNPAAFGRRYLIC